MGVGVVRKTSQRAHAHVIEIPPVRPPLKSQFSEWSSTDDSDDSSFFNEEDEDEEEIPPLPIIPTPGRRDSLTGEDQTPSSIFSYYYSKATPCALGGDWISFSSTPDEGYSPALDQGLKNGFRFPTTTRTETAVRMIPRSTPAETDITNQGGYFHEKRNSHPKRNSKTRVEEKEIGERVIREKAVETSTTTTPMEDFSPLEVGVATMGVQVQMKRQVERVEVEGMQFEICSVGAR